MKEKNKLNEERQKEKWRGESVGIAMGVVMLLILFLLVMGAAVVLELLIMVLGGSFNPLRLLIVALVITFGMFMWSAATDDVI